MIHTLMTVEQLASETIEMFLECRDQHGFPEDQARLLAVQEMVEGVNAEQELRAAEELPPLHVHETVNQPLVLCVTMPDRAHIQRDRSITFCGRVIDGPCEALSMRLCIRCMLEASRASVFHMERQLANGEY